MIEIIGAELYQWDTGRSVKVTGINASKVHFANQGDSKAPIMDIVNDEAKIPDYLLQTGKQLCVYAVANGVTIERKTFSVSKRERPEDYIYEEDQRNYIYELITNAENATNEASTAAENAKQATASATVATENANVATNNANLAADSANKAAIQAAHTAKSLMVVGNAKGEIIALNDAIDQFFVGCKIFGKTTQDGTPTPDAPVEMESVGDTGIVTVMVAGKNLISNNWLQGMLKTEDGTTLISNDYWITNADYIPVYSSKAYVLSADTPNSCCVFWYDEDKNFISFEQPLRNPTSPSNPIAKALMLPDYAKYARVAYNYAGATEVITPAMMGVKHYVQLEFGSTGTEYEPYKEAQTLTVSTHNGLPGIPVTSGGNYTDTTGQQWICDEIDLSRGVYVQRIGLKEFTGQETYYDYIAGARAVTTMLPHLANTHFICSHSLAGRTVYWVNASAIAFNVSSVGAATMDEFVAFVTSQYTNGTPIEIVYILADPIETPLSAEELAAYSALHTYRGNTTVTNDAGAYMELEYVMDAKKYIDSMIAGTLHPATVE